MAHPVHLTKQKLDKKTQLLFKNHKKTTTKNQGFRPWVRLGYKISQKKSTLKGAKKENCYFSVKKVENEEHIYFGKNKGKKGDR